MTDSMQQVEILRAASCVAGVDGRAGKRERKLLDRLAGKVGVGFASLEAMIERAETDERFRAEQFRILKSDPNNALHALLSVACVDGVITDGEREILREFATRLEVKPEKFEQLLARAEEYLESKKKT